MENKITKRLSVGETIPFGYKGAYKDWATDQTVFAIVPFHFVVALLHRLRDVYYRWASKDRPEEAAMRNRFREARNAAYKHGYDEGTISGYHLRQAEIDKITETLLNAKGGIINALMEPEA